MAVFHTISHMQTVWIAANNLKAALRYNHEIIEILSDSIEIV